jgi:hypothetical protein
MIRTRHCTPAILICLFASSIARADALQFTVDSTQSYLTLNIPNSTVPGTGSLNFTGQSRINGAPISTAWSASTTTGNTAFISGTFATTVGGSLSGQTLTAIQFISGANNLAAINSGNYRPNPAAYNTATSLFSNNSASPGAYGVTVHTSIGNFALISLDNVTYDIGSNSALPASGTAGAGTFVMNAPSNPVNAGILSSAYSLQGLPLLLEAYPSSTGIFTGVSANTDASGTYSFPTKSEMQLKIPISIPFSFDLGGTLVNGTASGQLVANAAVPEPSTLILAALGVLAVLTVRRRR